MMFLFSSKERQMKWRLIFPLFLAIFCLSLFYNPQFGFSKVRYSKFEISFSFAQYNSPFKSKYLSQYSPPFLSPGNYKSWAQQELNFQGEKNWGYGTGLAFFPSPYFGIQVLGRYFLVPLSGKNSPYNFHFEYGSITYDKEVIWPDSSGSLKQYFLGLNAVARIWLGRQLSLSLSGGGSYYYFKGEAAGQGFSKFWLSQQFWLESDTFQVMWTLNPEQKFGYNVAAELDLPFYRNFTFYAEFRYFFCPEIAFNLSYNEEASISLAQNIALIKQYLPLKQLTIKPSFSTINMGLKLKF